MAGTEQSCDQELVPEVLAVVKPEPLKEAHTSDKGKQLPAWLPKTYHQLQQSKLLLTNNQIPDRKPTFSSITNLPLRPYLKCARSVVSVGVKATAITSDAGTAEKQDEADYAGTVLLLAWEALNFKQI